MQTELSDDPLISSQIRYGLIVCLH